MDMLYRGRPKVLLTEFVGSFSSVTRSLALALKPIEMTSFRDAAGPAGGAASRDTPRTSFLRSAAVVEFHTRIGAEGPLFLSKNKK